jgi:hypothetical protein
MASFGPDWHKQQAEKKNKGQHGSHEIEILSGFSFYRRDDPVSPQQGVFSVFGR